jgi:hypothetical protein
MNLSYINNIKRSDLDKHIHIKKFILFKKIPNKDIVDYILEIVIEKDSFWIDFGYEIANIKYLWIEYYFNIILKNYGNSEYLTVLFNKIDYYYIDIKSKLDSEVCEIYKNDTHFPEYPNIKLTKLFYNLLNIDKTYTSKIRGIYPKKINNKEKKNLLYFININHNFINNIKKYSDNICNINQLTKNINKLEQIVISTL